jgi:hypothetical protein
MRCFTIIHGAVKRGIKPQVSRSGQVGICFRNKGKEETLELEKDWQGFFFESDLRRSKLSGGSLETVPILSAGISESATEPVHLTKVNLWNGRFNEPRKDRSRQALVLVRPPRDGKAIYTSSCWIESLDKGRVIRDYHVLGSLSPGVELVHGALTDEGGPTPGGFLLLMDQGSSFRMGRSVDGEPAEFIFQWWFAKRPSLKRLVPANWKGQREAA